MMNRYFEIQIFNGPEVSSNIVMGLVFQKLHVALAQHGDGNIGISFPDVKGSNKKTLGSIIRVCGVQEDLERLLQSRWQNNLQDYMSVTDIRNVPPQTKFCIVKRVQVQSSIERIRRRYIRKGWLTEEESLVKFASKTEKKLDLPFLHMKSLSTGQPFRLFIEHSKELDKPISGKFSAYGLSTTATVPWF